MAFARLLTAAALSPLRRRDRHQPQALVDARLPACAAGLEVGDHVEVQPQTDGLLRFCESRPAAADELGASPIVSYCPSRPSRRAFGAPQDEGVGGREERCPLSPQGSKAQRARGPRPEAPRSGLEGRSRGAKLGTSWTILRDAMPRIAPQDEGRELDAFRRRSYCGRQLLEGRLLDGASIYILRCADGSYYTGVTRRSVDERVSEHAQGLDEGCYTFRRRPVTLAHAEH